MNEVDMTKTVPLTNNTNTGGALEHHESNAAGSDDDAPLALSPASTSTATTSTSTSTPGVGKPLHDQSHQRQQLNRSPNSDANDSKATTNTNHGEERIQFTIGGKKKRKGPTTDGRKTKKKSAFESDESNVLDMEYPSHLHKVLNEFEAHSGKNGLNNANIANVNAALMDGNRKQNAANWNAHDFVGEVQQFYRGASENVDTDADSKGQIDAIDKDNTDADDTVDADADADKNESASDIQSDQAQKQSTQQINETQAGGGSNSVMITSMDHRRYTGSEKPKNESSSTASADGKNSNSEDDDRNQTESTPLTAVSVPAQPEGWRVKLYRLNADGSWDDCGTGRIVCLISKEKQRKDKNANTKSNGTESETGSEPSPSSHANNAVNKNSRSKMNASDAVTTSSEGSADDNVDTIADATAISEEDESKENAGVKEWASLEEEIYQTLGEPTLCMHAEVPANSQLQNLQLAALTNKAPKVLLRTRVLLRESYQRQGDNIITWCEPFFLPAPGEGQNQGENDASSTSSSQSSQRAGGTDGDDISCGVDLALSFQDNAGCREIWNKIYHIQHKAYELFEAKGGLIVDGEDEGLQEMSRQLMNQHGSMVTSDDDKGKDLNGNSAMYSVDHRDANNNNGSSLHNENRRDVWDESGASHSNTGIEGIDVDEHDLLETSAAAVSMAAQAAHYVGGQMGKNQVQGDLMEIGHASVNVQLCNPPTLDNLEKIADAIAALQLQQREAIAYTISQQDCAYLKALLALFPSAEAKNNYHALTTLASIVKSIFLFNEPNIIQFVASDAHVFEDCCCCLEYDPDLKEKANHRWFIQKRLKFRTVLYMEDEELIESIQKAFRVTYIRDTLLRPTMDESSLSTLGSLQTFTHADVVKGVMCAPRNKNSKSHDSYLVRILRLLGEEIRAIRENEWQAAARKERPSKNHSKQSGASSTMNSGSNNNEQSSAPWKQHLAPQDDSLSSRKVRRRGCLCFLREMFNMVRTSLQQSDRDDFYEMIVLLDVPVKVKGDDTIDDRKDDTFKADNNDTVNLLSLLGAILSDSNADVSERGACLDILSAIASHEPSLIRKHCLIEFSSSKITVDGDKTPKPGMYTVARPEPDDKREVIFACPPTDLCLSLLYVMATENDTGIMLQTCEVLRILLETEILNDPSQLDLGGVIDNEEDEMIGSDNVAFLVGSSAPNGNARGKCEQNSFLQMFYDHYVPWLVAPFQYSISVPKTAIPFSLQSESQQTESDTLLRSLKRRHQRLKDAKLSRTGLFKTIPTSPIRLSFSVEILSFCVRAHCFRMRRYLIHSRVLINVMKVLNPTPKALVPSGDRCLKLGALRCLRSIISLKDEFYYRHIVQRSLFTPVFEAFRANPVGDNLVSSSIIEMCEFIRIENIKSLIEDVVTKHMRQQSRQSSDTSIVKLSPSLEDVATPYVDTLTLLRQKYEENVGNSNGDATNDTSDRKGKRVWMSEKAMEDQLKFLEADEEESYFFDDVEDNNEAINCNNEARGQNGVRQGYRL